MGGKNKGKKKKNKLDLSKLPRKKRETSERSTSPPVSQCSNSSSGPVGLRNLGNTCFMNSALQCLAAAQPLVDVILKTPLPSTNDSRLFQVAKAFKSFIEYGQKSFESKTVYSPSSIKTAIAKIATHFSGYQQQDALDLMSTLLNAVSDAYHIPSPETSHNEDASRSDLNDLEKFAATNARFQRRRGSIITKLFYGYQKTSARCDNCCVEKSQFQPYLFLSIPLVLKWKEVTAEVHCISGKQPWLNYRLATIPTEMSSGLFSASEKSFTFQFFDNQVVNFPLKHIYSSLFPKSDILPSNTQVMQLTMNKENSNVVVNCDTSMNLEPNGVYIVLIGAIPLTVKPSAYWIKFKHPRTEKHYLFVNLNEKEVQLGEAAHFILPDKCYEKLEKENLNQILSNIPEENCIVMQSDKPLYVQKSVERINLCEGVAPKLTIEDCLTNFCGLSPLAPDSDWHCDTCKSSQKCTFQFSPWTVPPILVIHLRRFQAKGPSHCMRMEKVSCQVIFKETLDMRPYVKISNNPECETMATNYKLVGVACHYGSLSGGHYNAFCKIDGEWMKCDDSSVQKVQVEQVLQSAAALVLIYVRVDDVGIIMAPEQTESASPSLKSSHDIQNESRAYSSHMEEVAGKLLKVSTV